MLSKELLKKLRKYEIRIRKAINVQLHGDFHSVFKGTGLEFEDVRAYQYGDDIRAIDWNVTAKGHGTFVKVFREEKEQTVFFILDVSASQNIGRKASKKIDIAKEIFGVLTLSAIKEESHCGVICYSDKKELYIKPGKGSPHAYYAINQVFGLKPESKKTNLSGAIRFALRLIRRKSVIVFISDFVDSGYLDDLKLLASRHDLVILHLIDRTEANLPGLGIIPVFDKEAQKTIWVNSSSGSFQRKVKSMFEGSSQSLLQMSRRINANYMDIYTDEDYVPKLVAMFKGRNKRRRG